MNKYISFIYLYSIWEACQSSVFRNQQACRVPNLDESWRSKIDVHCLRQSETKNTINQTVASKICSTLEKQTTKPSCVFQSHAKSLDYKTAGMFHSTHVANPLKPMPVIRSRNMHVIEMDKLKYIIPSISLQTVIVIFLALLNVERNFESYLEAGALPGTIK